MIYLKNNTETQAIYIPRQTVLGGGYIPSTKAYDKGYNDGLEDGKEQQKGKLSNLNVTANGQYEREDGWNVVNVDVPDLNGSYNEGYEQGKTDGVNEQKSKLESISITENGTYNKEDGYNHIEVNVPSYEQGQADMAAKARILNVTENGTYLSKFSDPIMPSLVTGVYADGTNFYNYAQLSNKVFNTKIAGSIDSRLEFWYKGNNTGTGNAWDVMIGSGNNDDNDCFQVRYYAYKDDTLYIGVGNSQISVYNWDDTVWHHLIVSKAEGLWIDGEKKGDFSSSNTINGEFFINAIGYNPLRNANGYFGMIKIDDVVIIPTANGFLNTNTGELLEVVKDGGYTFTENLPTYGEGELYKTINVNVPDLNGSYDEGKIDGINEQKSKLETIKITVNGTFNGEDGWNKIIVNVPDYNEGYEQGQADIAANARVLNVTENGVYKSKFSDSIIPPTVTGVYADGTNFYNYAELTNKVFNTNIPATMDSRVELWYKGDNLCNSEGWDAIIGAGAIDDSNVFEIIYWQKNNNEIRGQIGSYSINTNWDENKWHHIILSVADGFIIDGVKIGDMQSNSSTPNGNFFINGIAHNISNSNLRNANGYFGMIKIDNTIIIPTTEGFLNTNTGELLEVVKDGTYTYTENEGGELYKTINVNVPLVSCNLEDKQVTPSMNDRDGNGYIVVSPSEGYDGLSRTVIDPQTIYNEGVEAGRAECVCPSVQEQSFNYDITAFTYKVYDWTSVNINRDNITNDCGHRPLDCLLFRNRSGECTVMTKLDTCSGVVRLENGWNSDNIILSLKSNSITKFSSNSINSNQLTSIDTGFAYLEGDAITNCSALTDIKVTVNNNDLSKQFATNCFNGLPAEGTITIGKNVDVTITNDEITSFFRTIVGEGWTITIKQ